MTRWDSQGRSVEGLEILNFNAELARVMNIKVTAGATVTVIAAIPIVDYRQVYAYAVTKTAEPHTFTLKIEHAHVGGTSGMYGNADASSSAAVTTTNRANTGAVSVRSGAVYVTLQNQDASDRYYDVVLGGLK